MLGEVYSYSIINDRNSLIDAIYENVKSNPSQIAVADTCKKISYRELWISAAELSNKLRKSGVKKASPVVVLLDHSVESLTAMLSIFMAGAVYVPLDIHAPEKSLCEIIERLAPSAVIGRDDIQAAFQSLGISIITEISYPSSIQSENLLDGICVVEKVELSDLSHMFFTSGTTGASKGVLSTYEALKYYIYSALDEFSFSREDVFLSIARPSFSISLFEILIPLVAGGRVRILRRNEALDLNFLERCLEGVTVAHIGPGLLRLLLKHLRSENKIVNGFPRIRHLSSGGDVVSHDLLTEAAKFFRFADVFILYGCTEINCMGTFLPFHADGDSWVGRVGKAMRGVEVLVLDEYGMPVNQGEVGSVNFKSKGLAKCYFQDEVLTKAKFRVSSNSERIYDSGDLGRINSHGELELIGRSDFQVKIRGMRVEILAVERLIRSYSCVDDCMVVGESAGHGGTTLIAYLVLVDASKFDCEKFKIFLGESLSDFMIPSKVFHARKLPLNKNLKLDRRSRPDEAELIFPDSSGVETAMDDDSGELAKIWCEVNEVSKVSPSDRFFDVGGNSLAAVSIIAKVMDLFRVQLNFEDFCDNPSFSTLVCRVSNGTLKKREYVIKLKDGDPNLPPIVLVCGTIIYNELANILDLKNPLYVIYMEEEIELIRYGLDAKSFANISKFEYLVSRYLQGLNSINLERGFYLGGHSFGGLLALALASIKEAQGGSVHGIYLFDSRIPNYFSCRGPFKKGLSYLKRLVLSLPKKILNDEQERSKLSKLTLLQAHTAASGSFSFPNVSAEIFLFRAKRRRPLDPNLWDLGWSPYYPQIVVKNIDGCHLGIMKKDKVQKIANGIEEYV
ncbi:AMP-binding protein [Microbulbifer pacificus]|uniref:AMP-binding protein n=1 Tax=Microbulbifer pacificus TaxID=407164 RepID=A0AAU0MXT4_9GAMM|nr:AMP-binding protein [Microbulbifer pacificus]WOX04826.1 AMP-binding protein [Microbulbifer pacificus]